MPPRRVKKSVAEDAQADHPAPRRVTRSAIQSKANDHPTSTQLHTPSDRDSSPHSLSSRSDLPHISTSDQHDSGNTTAFFTTAPLEHPINPLPPSQSSTYLLPKPPFLRGIYKTHHLKNSDPAPSPLQVDYAYGKEDPDIDKMLVTRGRGKAVDDGVKEWKPPINARAAQRGGLISKMRTRSGTVAGDVAGIGTKAATTKAIGGSRIKGPSKAVGVDKISSVQATVRGGGRGRRGGKLGKVIEVNEEEVVEHEDLEAVESELKSGAGDGLGVVVSLGQNPSDTDSPLAKPSSSISPLPRVLSSPSTATRITNESAPSQSISRATIIPPSNTQLSKAKARQPGARLSDLFNDTSHMLEFEANAKARQTKDGFEEGSEGEYIDDGGASPGIVGFDALSIVEAKAAAASIAGEETDEHELAGDNQQAEETESEEDESGIPLGQEERTLSQEHDRPELVKVQESDNLVSLGSEETSQEEDLVGESANVTRKREKLRKQASETPALFIRLHESDSCMTCRIHNYPCLWAYDQRTRRCEGCDRRTCSLEWRLVDTKDGKMAVGPGWRERGDMTEEGESEDVAEDQTEEFAVPVISGMIGYRLLEEIGGDFADRADRARDAQSRVKGKGRDVGGAKDGEQQRRHTEELFRSLSMSIRGE